ncbi:peptidylprolyl isomerase [Bacteriovorax sp. Seq25_V]|uniref:FKBP-type peptidyl-prolyl cis-trans isomerase n=1 Tax=Bacteriovorax sp. Seq25_V TaxID=1201288 RepID=UPI00038A03EC|nr:peptidylprolyl isomerase [Bacteriovorax sp. Seq25_V]EQC45616.1 peptidyl-prolyl cis-trans isomerase, FKBP-type [Bacteriovorax sp. Seq25_V]
MTQKVIGFHYTLKDDQGTTIDSSEGASPLLFLEGSGMIIPGLEQELVVMNVGDKKNVEVAAADAYGEVREDMVITVERAQFPPEAELNVGDQFRVNNNPAMPPFTVVKIEGESITLDGNHPLAGKKLFFDVEITESRAATDEEIAHGHAHGEGGHHH